MPGRYIIYIYICLYLCVYVLKRHTCTILILHLALGMSGRYILIYMCVCVCYSYIDISRHVLCSPRNARVICNMYVDLCVYLDIYIGNPWVCPSWICALPGDVVEDGISGVLRMEDQGSCPHSCCSRRRQEWLSILHGRGTVFNGFHFLTTHC